VIRLHNFIVLEIYLGHNNINDANLPVLGNGGKWSGGGFVGSLKIPENGFDRGRRQSYSCYITVRWSGSMLFSVDEQDPRPLYEQIVAGVKSAVADGRLAVGELLPGVRELAGGLGVNLHTVHKAYQCLRDDGVIDLRLGRRARISARRGPASKRIVQQKVGRRLEEIVTEAAMLGVSREEFAAMVERLTADKLKGAES
jgi:DNA-binding transcriptional regulator YhcF (GntR family)